MPLGGVGRTVKDSLDGVIEGIGVEGSDAAGAEILGAVEAAQEVGESPVTAARSIVGTTIRGVEVPEPKQIAGS